MLNASVFKEKCKEHKISVDALAGRIARGGMTKSVASSAIRNWQKGLLKPMPSQEDVRRLAQGIGCEANEISEWKSSYMYAPGSARKARLVSKLIAGRKVQDALDLLKFTNKRAASMFDKVLKSAIANADEGEANVDNLFISAVWVDDAGIRMGTKRWIAKDRGRAHAIRKTACHLHVKVSES